MYLRNAHSIFVKINPNVAASFSALVKLIPNNFPLLQDTLTGQSKCEIHENFISKLTALKISYHDNFWSKYASDDFLSSDCWVGKCGNCSDGKRVTLLIKPVNEVVKLEVLEIGVE